MKKTLKQLKLDRMYLLMIVKLFDGREKPTEVVICKQYIKMLEEINVEIENFES